MACCHWPGLVLVLARVAEAMPPMIKAIASTADLQKGDLGELDGDLVTTSASSESSIDSDDLTNSHMRSPLTSDCDNGMRTTGGSPSRPPGEHNQALLSLPKNWKYELFTIDVFCFCFFSSMMLKDEASNTREAQKPVNVLSSSQNSPTSPKRRLLGNHVPNLRVPYHGAFFSAPDGR
ncbi:hypothetical protein Ancab_033371 [Ancistrocladus abbreviatus]